MSDHHSNDEYYSGFAWALRKAFKEPLASCRFEQGDILYDIRRAYEGTWGDALHHLRYSIQIKSPKRGITSKKEQDEEAIFSDNWRQSVELDLTEYPSQKIRSVKTTQGRLYMTLWKGDISHLELNTPESTVPKQPKEVLNELPGCVELIKQSFDNPKHSAFFVMPYDETRDILCNKRQKILSCLSQEFDPLLKLLLPCDVGVKNAEAYVPTLKIACFLMDTPEVDKVYSNLKSALYTPAKDRKTTIDRFRLEKHGFLYPVPCNNQRVHGDAPKGGA